MRVGLVGAGSMGHTHAPAWKLLREIGAELVGVVTNNYESSEQFAQEFGIKAYDDYESLLADVDIIDLCVPTNLHRDMTIQAAQAGKHVICEKPIALSVPDAQAMIDACKAAGVRLFIAHVVRFIDQYRAAQQVIANGQIGTPSVIRLARTGYQPRKSTDNWFIDESRSGGMMLDLMVHDYDYARWLGGDVTRVYARSIRGKEPNAPGDFALVTLRFANGAMALIEGGWVYPPGHFRTSMDIAGTKGVIEWRSDSVETLRTYLAAPPEEKTAEVAVPSARAEDSPFTTELRHFYEALINGTEPIVTAQDALQALKIGLAARESARTGKSIAIEEVV